MLSIITHNSWKDSETLRVEFIELYKNPYCTVEYYETYFIIDELECNSIIEDGKTVHLIVSKLDSKSQTIYILNRMIDIDIKYINLIAAHFFKKHQKFKKIQFDHLTKPVLASTLNPSWSKLLDEDYIIQLPSSVIQYQSMLSSHMRRHTNNYVSKINRNIGFFSFCIYEKDNITDSVFNQLIDMKTLRMVKKKMVSAVTPTEANNILAIAKKYGFITTLEVNNEILAGMLVYSIDNRFFAHLISNNPKYDSYNVAHVCMYLTIQKCIELQGIEFHMLWGTAFYKKRFLAVSTPLHSITIFRTRLLKLIHVLEFSILPALSYRNLKRTTKIYLKNVLYKVFPLKTT